MKYLFVLLILLSTGCHIKFNCLQQKSYIGLPGFQEDVSDESYNINYVNDLDVNELEEIGNDAQVTFISSQNGITIK